MYCALVTYQHFVQPRSFKRNLGNMSTSLATHDVRSSKNKNFKRVNFTSRFMSSANKITSFNVLIRNTHHQRTRTKKSRSISEGSNGEKANMNYSSTTTDGQKTQDHQPLERLQDAHKQYNPSTRGGSSVEVKLLCTMTNP